MKWITNNGDLERVPGTENDKLTLGERMILQPELKLMNNETKPTQPTLPGFEDLPKTKNEKPNKKLPTTSSSLKKLTILKIFGLL